MDGLRGDGEGSTRVTEEQVRTSIDAHNKWAKAWRLKRKQCLEVVDTICEGADLKRRELFEKAGLDEDLHEIKNYQELEKI